MRGSILMGFAAAVASAASSVRAVSVAVGNPSFETPVAPVVPGVWLDAPPWVLSGPGPNQDLGDGVPRNVGTGIFPNPSASSSGHFDNADGNQLAYIFAFSGEQFIQTLGTTYEVGKQYQLTVGIGNAGSQPLATDALQISLEYSGTRAAPVVAFNTVLNNATNSLSQTHLNDFSATSGFLAPGNPAIGQPIIIAIRAIGGSSGQFDFDNVRLTVVPEPGSLAVLSIGAVGLLRCRRRR